VTIEGNENFQETQIVDLVAVENLNRENGFYTTPASAAEIEAAVEVREICHKYPEMRRTVFEEVR
jgi:hypothetical protein